MSSGDSRFPGTWKGVDGSNWVFEPDGKGKRNDRDLKYAFLEGKVVLYLSTVGTLSNLTNMYEYYFAGEGDSELFLKRASPTIDDVIWLKKKE